MIKPPFDLYFTNLLFLNKKVIILIPYTGSDIVIFRIKDAKFIKKDALSERGFSDCGLPVIIKLGHLMKGAYGND
jgi:hypothetical protein